MAKTLKRLALVFAFVLPLACGVALTACRNDKEDNATTYKVTYVSGVSDESVTVPVDNNEYKKGDKVTIKEGATREYYTFTGWLYTGGIVLQPGGQLTMPDRNVTLTAQWEGIESYTVTYDLAGGTYNGSETAPTETNKVEGATFTLAGAAEKEGYVFQGWNDGTDTYPAGATYTVGTENVTLTAVWAQLYSVTYSMGEWTDFDGVLPTEADHVEGDLFTLKQAPEREGYEFVRWEDEDGNDYQPGHTFVMPAKDVTITAIWAEADKIFTVTYDLAEYEGDWEHDKTARYIDGETVTLPEPPEFEDYDFVKWTAGEYDYQPGDTFAITEDVTITAVWRAVVYYTVTFDLGGYEGTVDGGKYRANATFNLPAALVQEGYTFYGWSTVARDKVTWNDLLEANSEYTITRDVTIYAIGQKTPVLGVGADDTANGIVNVASDIIIGNEDNPTIINLKEGVAGGDYTIRISASSFLNSAGNGYITFTVVAGNEMITMTSVSTSVEHIIEIPEDVTYIEIYGTDYLMHATVRLTEEYILRPDSTRTVTLASGESKTYTISFTYDEYGYYLWLKLEFSAEAQGVTAMFGSTDVSEGQPFQSSYNQTIVFTGKLDVTFTVTLAITEEPKEEAEHTLEVGGTLENLESTDDGNNNYYVLIDLVGTTPGMMYDLTFRTTADLWRKFYLDTDRGSSLGETAGWGGSYYEEDAVITFMMPDDTTTIKLRTFGNGQEYTLAFVTLTEGSQLDFEIKDKLEAGAGVKVDLNWMAWTAIELADSVGAGDYIVTLVRHPDSGYLAISLQETGHSDEAAFDDYTAQITIQDEKVIYIFSMAPDFEGAIVKLDAVEAPAGDIEVGQQYKTTVGSWGSFTEISLGSSVVPGDYTMQILDPNDDWLNPGQYMLGVGSYDDFSDPLMSKSNTWTVTITIAADVHTLYLYSFTDAGSTVTLLLTSVGGTGGGEEDPTYDLEVGVAKTLDNAMYGVEQTIYLEAGQYRITVSGSHAANFAVFEQEWVLGSNGELIGENGARTNTFTVTDAGAYILNIVDHQDSGYEVTILIEKIG